MEIRPEFKVIAGPNSLVCLSHLDDSSNHFGSFL